VIGMGEIIRFPQSPAPKDNLGEFVEIFQELSRQWAARRAAAGGRMRD
jgi:hypothetical protein